MSWMPCGLYASWVARCVELRHGKRARGLTWSEVENYEYEHEQRAQSR